jgi:VanZ family protein
MIAFLRKYVGVLLFPVLWTFIIAFLCFMPGSLIPNESGFSIPNFDKMVHAGMFGGFVFLWSLYLSNKISDVRLLLRLFFLVFLIANAYGIGSEFVQKCCIPLRDFDEADIIADMIGTGIGYGLSNIFLIPRNRP